MIAQDSRLQQRWRLAAQNPGLTYFSFGGRVNPNTEIMPSPATLTFNSSG